MFLFIPATTVGLVSHHPSTNDVRMMILTRSLLTISLILNVRQALTLPSDIDQLKDHFFANLIEETRGIAASPLTDDVERNINLKIEGFLDIISPPVARKQRDTNDLLLNEKSELDNENGSIYSSQLETRGSVESK